MVDDKEDILTKEIQSWDSFKYTLREENATLFGQMLKECQGEDDEEGEVVQIANAVSAKGESFAADSLFMTLILLQQRMINRLSCQL
jgi:hypothetical protein